MYDTTVLGPSGARDSSAITLREPGAEKAGPGNPVPGSLVPESLVPGRPIAPSPARASGEQPIRQDARPAG